MAFTVKQMRDFLRGRDPAGEDATFVPIIGEHMDSTSTFPSPA